MKTKEQKLQAVVADIRAKLPRLMELEKGCKISTVYSRIHEVVDEHKDLVKINLLSEKTDYTSMLEKYVIEDNNSPYKIIGKEPMLNDVLEWIEKGKSANTFNINSRGAIFMEFSATSGYCGMWDLSKPYLHQQSEELINFLYELL